MVDPYRLGPSKEVSSSLRLTTTISSSTSLDAPLARTAVIIGRILILRGGALLLTELFIQAASSTLLGNSPKHVAKVQLFANCVCYIRKIEIIALIKLQHPIIQKCDYFSHVHFFSGKQFNHYFA